VAQHQPVERRTGRRGPAPAHTRAEIVAAAVAIADAEGLAAVSMRAVATRLGTAAASLYRYLDSRADLLNLMADAVIGELPVVAPADDPFDVLVEIAEGLRLLFKRHTWLIEAAQNINDFGPNSLEYFERCLAAMVSLPAPALAKLDVITMLPGIASVWARPQPGGLAFAGIDWSAYPNLAAALAVAASGAQVAPDRVSDLFARTIRGLLRGLLT
jgi:AcrR family transcriptional regulator